MSDKELYGSGSISMFTAAQETRRLLHLGPRDPRRRHRPPFRLRPLLSSRRRRELRPRRYARRVRFSVQIRYISFAKRHFLCALERPDIARVLFSPHYNRSGKGLSLALIKINITFYPEPAPALSPSDFLRSIIERRNKRPKKNPNKQK